MFAGLQKKRLAMSAFVFATAIVIRSRHEHNTRPQQHKILLHLSLRRNLRTENGAIRTTAGLLYSRTVRQVGPLF
jgi:hypothetical protein